MNSKFELPPTIFDTLRENQSSLSYSMAYQHGEKGPGVSGEPLSSFGPEGPGLGRLPVELMAPNDVVTFVVPAPPGVSALTLYTQFGTKSVEFSANGAPFVGYEPHIFPVGYNSNTDPTPTEPLKELRRFTIAIKSLGAYDPEIGAIGPILFMGASFTWILSDPALYSAWLAAGKSETPTHVPAPESELDRLARLAQAANLVEPIMAFGGVSTLPDLIVKLDQTGTMDGLKRLIKLAKEEK